MGRFNIKASIKCGTRWTMEIGSGETICAICGKRKGNRTRCCATSPYMAFEDFMRGYFPEGLYSKENPDGVPVGTAREFYDEFRNSNMSLKEYKRQTIATDEYGDPVGDAPDKNLGGGG